MLKSGMLTLMDAEASQSVGEEPGGVAIFRPSAEANILSTFRAAATHNKQ